MEKAGVYRIVVKHIGYAFYETKDIRADVKEHRRLLEAGRHYNVKLQELFNVFGERYFSYEVIARTNDYNLRQMLWHSQCKTWICNLNDYGPMCLYIHKDHMPNEKYWSMDLYLERIEKTRLMFVCESKNGPKLGIEMAMDNVRSGSYRITDKGTMLPLHARRWHTIRETN